MTLAGSLAAEGYTKRSVFDEGEAILLNRDFQGMVQADAGRKIGVNTRGDLSIG
jgi:hypothetical protein